MSSPFSLVHKPSGKVIASVTRADGWWAKGWGVIGWSSLPPGQGLWLPGVSAVHTVFVRFPLDLLFLDTNLATLRHVPGVRPGRLWVSGQGARHTIELGAGSLAGLPVTGGERWELRQEES